MISLCIYKVSDLTTEAYSEFCRVRALDNLLMGILPEEPCREQVRGELRLSVSRWHINNEPFALTTSNAFEGICHFGMVSSPNECRPHLFDECQELILRQLLGLKLCELLKLG